MTKARRSAHIGGFQEPLFVPDSSWVAPSELPDLRRHKYVALDTEERDEGLAAEVGPAWFRRGGYVAGVSVAWDRGGGDLGALYAPIRHPDTPGLFDPECVRRWLDDHTAAGVHWITQNGMFDWGWLSEDLKAKVPPSEQWEEVGAAATMVDEDQDEYGLDAICARLGLPGKDEALLREAGAAYGFHTHKEVKANLWRMPGRHVGPYAEADGLQTWGSWHKLMETIRAEGTEEAYRLECDLLPLIVEMRRRGVRVDLEAAERHKVDLLAERDRVFVELGGKLGARVGMEEIGRNAWLERTFAQHAPQINVPRTAATSKFPHGQASFTAGSTGWMHKHPHWLPQLIVRADKLHNAATKFLQGYIIDFATRGRIHAEVHPHRSEGGDGTKTTRLSYAKPPLQQMTARDAELAPMIRGVFLPEPGEVWAKPDQSQQEYRLTVHFAALLNCRGAEEAVRAYHDDPDTDFHMYVVEITGLDRKSAKDTNFAKAFGAGIPKFAAMINKSIEEAEEIYKTYDAKLPFVSQLYQKADSKAQRTGFIRMLDGARRHFERWEPKWLSADRRALGWGAGQKMYPTSRDEALARTRDPDHAWSGARLKRSDTKDAMNSLIQGSAARQTKLWMRACWREGVVPLLQLHDELDASVKTIEEARLVQRLGQEAVSLRVPVKVDVNFGPSWGAAKCPERPSEKEWREMGPAAQGMYDDKRRLVWDRLRAAT